MHTGKEQSYFHGPVCGCYLLLMTHSHSLLPLMLFFLPCLSGPSRNKEVMEQVDIST